MAADYIPGADGNFDAWQNNFLSYATANAVALGPPQFGDSACRAGE